MLNRLKVSAKLALLLALPVAGFAYFNLRETYAAYQAGVQQGHWAQFWTFFCIAALVWAATLWLAWLLSRAILHPLRQLSRTLANSDLATRLDDQAADEFGDLARSFNAYNAHLREVFRGTNDASARIASGALQLSAAAEQMLRTAQDLAARSEAQRRSGETTSREAGQLQAVVQEVEDHVRTSLEEAEHATRVAQSGATRSQGAATAMDDIRGSSERIAQAVRVIQDIARQTNLLSLNAAIEASKAGVHGRGFAVVAEEIRKLAERSAVAAREIDQLIQGSDQAVHTGSTAFASTLETLADLGLQIQRMSARIHEIGGAAQRQAASTASLSAQVGLAAQEILANAAASEELSAAVQQVARTASDLARIAEELQKRVALFRH